MFNRLFAGAKTPYNVPRSARFSTIRGSNISRIETTGGTNYSKFTFSVYVKRAKLGVLQYLFTAADTGSGTGANQLRFNASDQLEWCETSSLTIVKQTTAKFDDPTNFYHIVVVGEQSQTGANKIRIYVNNVLLTAYGTNNTPAATFIIGSDSKIHVLGALAVTAANPTWGTINTASSFEGWMANAVFVTGEARLPTSFGKSGTSSGDWTPIKYKGSVGEHGFEYLFETSSFATNTGKGKASPLWYTAGFQVSDSTLHTYDWSYESPVAHRLDGIDRGSFGNWQNNFTSAYNSSDPTDTNCYYYAGGDNASTNSRSWFSMGDSASGGAGKWYWEIDTMSGFDGSVLEWLQLTQSHKVALREYDANGGFYYSNAGTVAYNGSGIATYGTLYAASYVMFAVDCDADASFWRIYVGIDGTWQNSGNPAAGTGYVCGTLPKSTGPYTFGSAASGTPSQPAFAYNPGHRPFKSTVPTGFRSISNYGLPAVKTSGSFTGNASAAGPIVYLNGTPTSMTINGNPVTFGTHAKLNSQGVKIITTSTSYNTAGTNTYTAVIPTHASKCRAQLN